MTLTLKLRPPYQPNVNYSDMSHPPPLSMDRAQILTRHAQDVKQDILKVSLGCPQMEKFHVRKTPKLHRRLILPIMIQLTHIFRTRKF